MLSAYESDDNLCGLCSGSDYGKTENQMREDVRRMMYIPKNEADQFRLGMFFESLHQIKMALIDHTIKGVFRMRKVKFKKKSNNDLL